ncbi:disintegrin and metalloproteinase domain-containing protein 15 [Kryptolebias marmoratus]|uniref:disintegrin and metalloproteinase domain-containing protein 15 n=1 Tax=Kryptolebias marmoratus TaxID=37003 RepID=UPI0018ACEFEB|nr:disintegrin and metalloproteinase domain-containing protein 15 [Kryptolebias marmoratus]
MSGAAGLPPPLLLLLLLGGRAAFTGCRSLNAPRDGLRVAGPTDGSVTGVDRRRRPVLETTRPFVLVDGQRRSLAEAFQEGHPDRLQCGLEVGGHLLLLDLEKNHHLMPKPPNIFFYLPNGTGVSVTADPVTHCYYHGSVRGFPRSRVALSTCSGLRGVVVLNSSLSFELQPPDRRHHHQEEGNSSGGGGDEEEHLLFPSSPLEGAASEGCGVSPTSDPPAYNSSHTHRVRPTRDNPTVQQRDVYKPRLPQDHLVSVLGVASTVAHELGHNLGMKHDTAERRCSCQNEPRLGGCIMEPSTGFMPGQLFSSCSAADLSVSLLHGGGMCLFNVPQPERLLGGPRCGNLYVEKGEQCDCGLLEECADPCCNASTCQLVPGAQCSSDGVCCQDCKLRAAGSVCRETLGDCDLPEFCTGSSPYCPPNVFLQNGEPCEDGSAYCYGGVCANMDAQCQMLWGPNATSAPDVCFSSVNKQGSKHGNCGQLTNGSYVPCGNSDVLCGRIQCQGGMKRPLLGSMAQILSVRFNNSDLVCRGTFFHLYDDVADPAAVAQGTACGPGKACWNQKCEDVSVFGVDACRRKCSGHGVCNSNKNCHCDVGWAPPDCRYSGHGGSVDSGPARIAAESNPVQAALLVIFFFVVPVVLLFLALRFPRFRQFCCLGPNSPFHKARQHNRTPVRERVDGRNGDQVRPLRYHLNLQPDIPLTPPQKQVHDRPAPPTKPLPPDPALNPSPQLVKPRPAPPTKPLPPDPPAPSEQPLVTRPAPPNKPLPPDPVTPAQVCVPLKPVVPKKPRLPDTPRNPYLPPQSGPAPPATFTSSTKPVAHGAVAPAAGPHRRPPLRPTRPAAPPTLRSSPLL